MREIIVRNWDLREFHVWVNLPSLIQPVQVPIRHVITRLQGLPNPIRQVVPLISHIRLYSTLRFDLHPPSLSFSSTTPSSLHNTKWSYPALSVYVIIMSWHWVQHIQSTASTEYSIISKMYFSQWKPPGVSERIWSIYLDASISGEYQTLEGHSCWPLE
jgi:hypothetical protein